MATIFHKKRFNRAQVEWMQILTPVEYCLMDKMLFQSNLVKANNGEGFTFHVRTLAKECSINKDTVCQTLKRWRQFLTKKGFRRNMEIKFDYEQFMKWIVCKQPLDCMPRQTKIVCPDIHRSITKEVEVEVGSVDLTSTSPSAMQTGATGSLIISSGTIQTGGAIGATLEKGIGSLQLAKPSPAALASVNTSTGSSLPFRPNKWLLWAL